MKKTLDTQEAKTSKKKHEFENLTTKFFNIQHLINLNSTVSSIQNGFGSLVQRSIFYSIIQFQNSIS